MHQKTMRYFYLALLILFMCFCAGGFLFKNTILFGASLISSQVVPEKSPQIIPVVQDEQKQQIQKEITSLEEDLSTQDLMAESNQDKIDNILEKINTLNSVKESNLRPLCYPSYSGACLDPNASDYDCLGGSGNGPYYTGKVRVIGPDVFGLDRDGDGWGCE